MQKNEYKVYVLKNKFTDKIVYVGITRNCLKIRYNSHVAKFKFNRNHYGINLVVEGLTVIEAAELEKLLIIQYDTLNNGWNVSPGSINGFSNYHSEEQKAKWSSERKGKKVSDQHAAKNRVARIGHKNSEAWKKSHVERRAKPVMCLETGIIYPSARHAATALNLQYSKISLVCNKKRNSTGGLHFVFVEKQ